ncbi:MAG: zinc-binding dehydrogenase, partial [Thaumarchaeota archaeon]|nr:zinc-binding dehydrogenase [Nitrososphaerota archaeon]
DSLSDLESAPLFCPGVTAYRAVRRSGATLGKQAAVGGIGGVGHLAIQFAKLAGAHVTAITSSSPHADLAREVGADETILLTPIVDAQRRDFLINVAKSMITSLPEKEDRITSVVDVGDSIANLIGEVAGLKGPPGESNKEKNIEKQ